MHSLKLKLIVVSVLFTACGREPQTTSAVQDAPGSAQAARTELAAESASALWKLMSLHRFRNEAGGVGATLFKADEVRCTQIVVPGFPYRCNLVKSVELSADALVTDGRTTAEELKAMNAAISRGLEAAGVPLVRPSGMVLGSNGKRTALDLQCYQAVVPNPIPRCSIATPSQPAQAERATLSADGSDALFTFLSLQGYRNEAGGVGATLLRTDEIACAQIVVPGFPYHCTSKKNGRAFDGNAIVSNGTAPRDTVNALSNRIFASLRAAGVTVPRSDTPVLGSNGVLTGLDIQCSKAVAPRAVASCTLKKP